MMQIVLIWKMAFNARWLDLVKSYATIGKPDAQGFIERGSYSVRGGKAPDDYMIWGDYYYLEALVRLEKGIKGYWYE